MHQNPVLLRKLFSTVIESKAVEVLFSGYYFFADFVRKKRGWRSNYYKTLLNPCTINGLNIWVTNICNVNCIFCAYQHQTRTKGIMPLELFKNIIDKSIGEGINGIGLTPTIGEPLIDKNLEEKILYMKDAGIKNIGLTTNGILLTHDRFDKLERVDKLCD